MTRIDVDELEIPVPYAPKSLAWEGDVLVDWVGGGARYVLTGEAVRAPVRYAYTFDAAITLTDSPWAVIFQRLGTKGLLLRDGKIVRELNRSYYQADAYAYPVCLLRSPDDRVLVAHCPDEYNRIEFDDAVTGERLTASGIRAPSDFFHSRLQASPDGKRLMSAGWVWQPFDMIAWFDVALALTDPTTLDLYVHAPGHRRHTGYVEETSASWQTSSRVLIGGGHDPECPEEVAMFEGARITAKGLAVYDLDLDDVVASCSLGHSAGTMMPVGDTHVVTFYDHPRLYRIEGGVLEHAWPDIVSGKETSSILRGCSAPAPPIALDPAERRFAVVSGKAIHVITIGMR